MISSENVTLGATEEEKATWDNRVKLEECLKSAIMNRDQESIAALTERIEVLKGQESDAVVSQKDVEIESWSEKYNVLRFDLEALQKENNQLKGRIVELETQIPAKAQCGDAHETPAADPGTPTELTAEQILALESTETLTAEQKGRYKLILMDYAAEHKIVVKGSYGLDKMIEAIKNAK